MIHALGADPGSSAAWALVELERGSLPRFLALAEVHGSEDKWLSRARDGLRACLDRVPEASPDLCWIERPPDRVRRDASVRHHASAAGLGIRAGMMAGVYYMATGKSAELVDPGTWQQRAWGRGRVGPKAQGADKAQVALQRVRLAASLVPGSRPVLEAISMSRQADCAEAVLIAGAAALACLARQTTPALGRRAPRQEDE